MTIKMIETAIPFSGFYEAHEPYDLERELDLGNMPEFVGRVLTDVIWMKSNFQAACLAYSKAYCQAIQDEIESIFSEKRAGIPVKFKELQSPREYNFTTDRIFAEMPVVWFKYQLIKLRDEVRQIAKDKFTSRDGFISFYASDIDGWPECPSEWDANQLECIVLAALRDLRDGTFDFTDQCMLMGDFECNGGGQECLDAAFFENKETLQRVYRIAHHFNYERRAGRGAA